MDFERLPPLPHQAREALNHALDREQVRKHSEAAAASALESIRPLAAFAEELIDESVGHGDRTRSHLLKIEQYPDGPSIYLSARSKDAVQNRTPESFMFVASIGVELTKREFASLPIEDQRRMIWLGKTVENKDCYGIETETESLSSVTEGYEDLDTIEAVEARKNKSIDKIPDIEKTIEYIKTAILSAELNPGAFAVFPDIVHRTMLERGRLPESAQA